MIALSIRQPWASLILNAGKDIENRDWPTKYRGRILIHAAKGCTRMEFDDAIQFAEGCIQRPITADLDTIPRGGIVGSVEIVDCVADSQSPWFVGRYGFVLRDPKPLPFTPCKGRLGFFDVPAEALATAVAHADQLGLPVGRLTRGQRRYLAKSECVFCEYSLAKSRCGSIYGPRCSEELMAQRRAECLKAYKPRSPIPDKSPACTASASDSPPPARNATP